MISPVYALDAQSSFHTRQRVTDAVAMSSNSKLINFINAAIDSIGKAQKALGTNSYESEYFNYDDYVDKSIGNAYKNVK